jgi:hypothetical protein
VDPAGACSEEEVGAELSGVVVTLLLLEDESDGLLMLLSDGEEDWSEPLALLDAPLEDESCDGDALEPIDDEAFDSSTLRAARVSESSLPLGWILFSFWNAFNAAWVFGPRMPSAAPGFFPACDSFSCTCFTVSFDWLWAPELIEPALDCSETCDALLGWACDCWFSMPVAKAAVDTVAINAAAIGRSFIQGFLSKGSTTENPALRGDVQYLSQGPCLYWPLSLGALL